MSGLFLQIGQCFLAAPTLGVKACVDDKTGSPPDLIVKFAEFFCAIALLVGFKTRWVAIPLVINMAVAFYFNSKL